MSFILDAIAKSERERQQQEPPDARILAMPLGAKPRPRRTIPYILTGALILNVILLALWIQSGPSLFSGLSQTTEIELESPAQSTSIASGSEQQNSLPAAGKDESPRVAEPASAAVVAAARVPETGANTMISTSEPESSLLEKSSAEQAVPGRPPPYPPARKDQAGQGARC